MVVGGHVVHLVAPDIVFIQVHSSIAISIALAACFIPTQRCRCYLTIVVLTAAAH